MQEIADAMQLSTEQQFRLVSLEREAESLSKQDLTSALVEVARQLFVYRNICASMMKKDLTNGIKL